MLDKMNAKIRFFGTDFTDIFQYIDQTAIVCDNEKYKGCIREEKENILLAFLENINFKTEHIEVSGNNSAIFNKLDENKYYFQGLVGVVSGQLNYPICIDKEDMELILDITLEIHSRFDVEMKDGKSVITKPYFLATMLRHGKKLTTTGNMVDENLEDYFFDFLLVFKFANCLKDAYEKGYYRTYHRFERNDDRLKGSIDIARHMKENMGLNNGKIAYSYREKTVNNYVNHLLVETYTYIQEKYEKLFWGILDADEIICKMVAQLKLDIEYPLYDQKEIIAKNTNPISHPYYSEYELLREVCLKILRDEGSSIFNGSDSEVEGILYYLPDLWEEFLQDYLQDSQAYYMTPQCSIKIFDFDNNGIFAQDTRPDYVFFSDEARNHPFMILDAKFKPAWGKLISKKTWDKNLAEDYNKCIRDMNSIDAQATGIICPSREESVENQIAVHNISKFNSRTKFYSFAIYVPFIEDDEHYERWEQRFLDHLKGRMCSIKEIIEKEKSSVML